jgi:hypothetical protein
MIKLSKNIFFGYSLNLSAKMPPGTIFIDIGEIAIYIYDLNSSPNLLATGGDSSGGGSGGGLDIVISDSFSDLPDGSESGELSYVKNSQGTLWLPGTLGGNFYPEGWYVWSGSAWVSDRNQIANAINSGLGGGGAVSSVNTQTGTVVLDADDISDSATTNKFVTSGQLSEIAANTSKTGITTTQSNAITSNTSKISYTDAAAVGANTAKIGYTDQAVSDYIKGNQTSNTKTVLTSSSGVINWTGAESNLYEIVLTEDTVINNPSAPVDGSSFLIRVKQDGIGLWELTYGSDFKWSGGVAPTITPDTNAKDYISVVVDGTSLDSTELQNML